MSERICPSSQRQLNERLLTGSGLKMTPVMDIGSVDAAVRMLLSGFGTTFIPEYTVTDHLKRGELAQIKTKGYDIELRSGFLCSSSRWINPLMQEFIRIAETR